ncbi:lipoyl(octanoyl) transferase LipB [Kocuria sp. JC486]|uniref:Octanoyltransferase n=1 Tax=Kocuria soli TaxID=2485125 RepID=A0A3N3ZRL6_9MICC|nr:MULTISPECIES: lipoyl(octanoyl) transferase LipB [Kocuria]NHU84385.1 lipoyl(octanoyl) transferase LipB [Kocuria sp. JC486]ROZ63969.1 lipoyl(octanoyl) transferase LipB [Kocuria soli]
MSLSFERLGFAPDLVPYAPALELQKSVHQQVVARERANTVLLMEHEPVYTAGRRSSPEEYPQDGTEVVEIGRGGKITWHGPGQLVAYPITRLNTPIDVVKFVRVMEQLVISVLAEFGVTAVTVEGRSGAWIPADARGGDRKISAIGVQVSRRTTMHGISLNCSNDLAAFGDFIPCGISDAGVTSISRELGRNVEPVDVVDVVIEEFRRREAELCEVSEIPRDQPPLPWPTPVHP